MKIKYEKSTRLFFKYEDRPGFGNKIGSGSDHREKIPGSETVLPKIPHLNSTLEIYIILFSLNLININTTLKKV